MLSYKPHQRPFWRIRPYHKVMPPGPVSGDLGAYVLELVVEGALGGIGIVGEVIVHRTDGVRWMTFRNNHRLTTVTASSRNAAIDEAMRQVAAQLNLIVTIPSSGERSAMLDDIGIYECPEASGFRAGYAGKSDIHPMGLARKEREDWCHGHQRGVLARKIWEGSYADVTV